jgi:AraC-like DNA-binding protein
MQSRSVRAPRPARRRCLIFERPEESRRPPSWQTLSDITIALPESVPCGKLPAMQRLTPNYDGMRVLWDNRNLRSDRVSFGQIRYEPGGYCGPRLQRHYELVILHSGECDVRVDHSHRQLPPGSVRLLRPGHRELLRFSPTTETHQSWCKVVPSFLSGALRRELDHSPTASFPGSESFQRILSAAFLLRPGQRPAAARVIDALGLALFTEFLDIVHQAHGEQRGDDAVRRALRHMEDHFATDDCLATTRQAAGCSVNALIYKFRHDTGLTPARYLWKLRTEKGIAMLAETGLTVGEIAGKCGFKNPFHFTRLVRQHDGHAPRELRRRAWA